MSLFLPIFSLSDVGCYVMVLLGLSLRLLDMCRCLLTLQCFRMAVCSHLRWCYSQRTMELRDEPITSRGWGLRKRKLCSFILRQNFKEVTLSDSDSMLYQRLSMLSDWRTDNSNGFSVARYAVYIYYFIVIINACHIFISAYLKNIWVPFNKFRTSYTAT
jgi:hypothetical protein